MVLNLLPEEEGTKVRVNECRSKSMVLQAEVARKDHLRSLRAALTKRCKQAGFDGVGGSIFDKTLFALLRFTQQDEEAQNDPLIPFLKVLPASEGRKVMVEELARAGMKARAEAIVDEFFQQYAKAAKALAKLKRKSKRQQQDSISSASDVGSDLRSSDEPPRKIQRSRRGHDEHVQFSKPDEKSMVKVSHAELGVTVQLHRTHLSRMRRLYLRCNGGSGGSDDGEGGGSSGREGRAALDRHSDGSDSRDFRVALLRVLLRYQALGCGGFQCALPEAAFTVLAEGWGVRGEGFASPFNCRLEGAYGSAFADTDACFGSLGSFFDFTAADVKRHGGSFELNPPFSLDTYAAVLQHCERLLAVASEKEAEKGESEDDNGITFVVVVGATPTALAHESLQGFSESAYLTGHTRVGIAEHVYLQGTAQSDLSSDTFRACDTGIYILQSPSASRRWPTTPEKLLRLGSSLRANGQ